MVNFAYVAVALFGAIFGSFASALIPRLKEGRSMSKERSACPACDHTLGVLDLFPILSFALLRWKCRHCGAKIPAYHFLLECLMCAVFVLSGMYLVDMSAVLMGDTIETIRLGLFLVAGFVAVTFTVYDIMYMEIPDQVILPCIAGLFVLLCVDHFSTISIFSHYMSFGTDWMNLPLANGIVGTAIIFGFFFLQIVISDGTWMGGGDLRIAIFMGLLAGTKIALIGLFAAYIIGSFIGVGIIAVKRSRNIQVPFGPYLAAGLYVSLFFHNELINWYLGLLHI